MGALDGKRALITGGASGIGRAAALLFAGEGAAVAVADRDRVRGQEVAQEIADHGGRGLFISADVTRAQDCKTAVERTVDALGGLNVLFNNAGVIVRRTVMDLEEDEWDRVMEVNVKSVFLMSKFAIPAMASAGGGSIINMSSGWGLAGGPKAAAYCASKGAVVLLTKAMALDCGPEHIRVNCLCPGDVDTPLLREEARQLGVQETEFLADAAKRPLRRVGTPEDIARAALFLASDASSYITGTALVVDGGGLAGG
jgi:NAD(P)-dependent dehydrogenase (short-subunit alcohol dehydrogenase family)